MATTSSISPLSSAWVQNLVDLTLTSERKPLTNMQSQRDTLQLRKAIYSDISSKINALKDSITALQGLNNVFGQKAVSVTNPATGEVIRATTSSTSAVSGTYGLTVNDLAQSHQIGSAQQTSIDLALGQSGTFKISGLASRAVSGSSGSNNPVSTFATGDIRSGELELNSGKYYVEFKNDSGWKFQVVDKNGQAVRVDDVADNGIAMASGWQSFDSIKGQMFDTGRGLKITFANTDPTQDQRYTTSTVANATYSAQEENITIVASDTLNNIRSKINSVNYTVGKEVQATIVDRRLVLTGINSGESAAIKLFDSSYNGAGGSNDGLLFGLGIKVDQNGLLTDPATNQLRTAQDAKFDINGIKDIKRSKNTGLIDLVQGLSIDLVKKGDATITISDDTSKIETEVKKFVDAANSLRGYLKEKTEAKAGSKDAKGNTTYTSATLGQDWSVRSLRQGIANDLLKADTQAAAGDPKYLAEIGISVADDGSFKLDSSKLNSMLKSNFSGVRNLFDHMLQGNGGAASDTSLYAHLDRYVTGASAVLTTTQTGLDNQLKNLNSQISSYQKRLTVREAALVQQYSAIQEQMLNMTYSYQSFAAGNSYNQQY